MSSYVHYTEEEIECTSRTDLVQFRRDQYQELKRSGSEFEWRDGSAKVTICGNEWYHQYEKGGGDVIFSVRRFYNKTFPEAMDFLLGENCSVVEVSKKKQPKGYPGSSLSSKFMTEYVCPFIKTGIKT